MKGKRLGVIIMLIAAAAFALSACGKDGSSGSTGATGATGPAGPAGPGAGTNASTMTVAELGAALESSTVTIGSVTIASPPVVNFTIKDARGNGITGLNKYNTSAVPGLEYIRFGIAKLVPGTNGSPNKWVNYIVTTTARPPVATPPTSDREGTLVDNGGGSYTYTFYRDLAKIKDTAGVTDVTYEPTLTHRLIIAVTPPEPDPPEKFWRCVNKVFDFTIDPTTKAAIPLTATSTRRDITTTERCNSCHTDISKMFMNNAYNDGHHFDTRPDARNCILCHNDQQRIGVTSATSVNYVFAPRTETNRRLTPRILDGEVMFDFPIMIHKLHMGNRLAKTGYNSDGVLFNEKVYTQDVTNCRKCHSADTAADLAATPQGNNWKDKPSRLACGSCHDGIDWATGNGKTVKGLTTGHPNFGVGFTNDATCSVCHTPDNIELKHLTANATPNNPSVPAGAGNFTYVISSVTVNASNQPVVTFQILNGTTPVTFNTYTGTTNADAWNFVQRGLLTNFAGSPSFLVAYADGTDTSVDYNNKGKAAAQPASVSIAELAVGAAGTLAVGSTAGTYVATINNTVSRSSTTGAVTSTSTATFPAGSKMRAIALQGYFTQTNLTAYPYTPPVLGGASASGGLARHTISVIKGVTGDTVRRAVVDSAKCGQCHEWFEGHGGNRVYTVAVCVTCHNPNLSTSGRGANIANMSATDKANIIADGYAAAVATDVLKFPEASNNMKEMIHGIHSPGVLPSKPVRSNPFRFVRDRGTSGVFYYDWSHVAYPATLKNCETCHKPDTYSSVPTGALATTNVTTGVAGATWSWSTGSVTGGEAAVADVATARGGAALPGANNLVISPYAGVCVFCHDSSAARAHMAANGGQLNVARSAYVAGIEQCVICHGAGRSADVTVMHK